MICPSCRTSVPEGAWICPFCDHILDHSFLEQGGDEEEPREERTKIVAWPTRKQDESVPDAMILGRVSVEEDEFSVVHGAGAGGDGRTSTFLYYTSGSATRIILPEAIPRIVDIESTLPRTPYEDFILSCIDGRCTVREIQRASGLAAQEVVVTLLTLLDKGAIAIGDREPRPKEPSASKKEVASTLQLAKTPLSAGPVPAMDDFDDLPSVSDFEVLEPSAKAVRPATDSDVWSMDPVVPADLDASDSEEVTTEMPLPDLSKLQRPASPAPLPRQKRSRVGRSQVAPPPLPTPPLPTPPPLPPAMAPAPPVALPRAKQPQPLEETTSNLEALSGSFSSLDMPSLDGPEDSAATADLPPAKRIEPAEAPTPLHVPQVSLAAAPTPPPLALDPGFLVEIPPSTMAPAPVVEPSRVVQARMDSGGFAPAPEIEARKVIRPAQERVRRADPDPPKPEVRPEPKPEPKEERPRDARRAEARSEPIDPARMARGQKLFDQALKDKAEGNLVSARMNLKLAMSFDPSNEIYQQAFDELSRSPEAKVQRPVGRTRARELYDAATEAESRGDVDGAIELLEKAIQESRQAAFLNRLGVILAMKKHDFLRAQQLVEQSIELSPSNATYEKNLQKILSMAAIGVGSKDQKQAKKGLLGFLGRKK